MELPGAQQDLCSFSSRAVGYFFPIHPCNVSSYYSFICIDFHWNLNCWVCKLLESGSLFHVALIWGVIPETKSPLRGQGPHASPSIMSLHACTFSRNAPGFCCWQGVLGDACSASAICALSYQLNHGDLHGNPMRPGISVPLCI